MTTEKIQAIFAKINTKNIYCWGSGKHFKNLTLPFLCSSGLVDNLKGFIEPEAEKNSSSKKKIEGLSKSFDIISKVELSKLPKDDTLILISAVGYDEILSQLNQDASLTEIKAIPSIFLEALYEDLMMLKAPKPPLNYRKNKVETIPRIIHTFWFSDDVSAPNETKMDESASSMSLPSRYQKCLESWKKYAPDYEIKIWNQHTYHANNCLFYDQAIEQKAWAFASDYARADVLRRYGGVYMDLDVEMLRPIDDLLYNDAYMSFESPNRIECGSGMGAKAGNKILDEICKDYESRPFIKEDGSFDMSTCPVRFTKIIEKHGLVKNGGFQTVDDITIYPFEILSAKSFDSGIIYTTKQTYTIHHHNGSWVPELAQDALDKRYEKIMNFINTF